MVTVLRSHAKSLSFSDSALKTIKPMADDTVDGENPLHTSWQADPSIQVVCHSSQLAQWALSMHSKLVVGMDRVP